MKLALAVLNVGGGCIHQKSRESFLSACDRWGCDFVEFTEPLRDIHHFWQKAFAPLRLADYDRVIQLDADMLIRWDAPSPFDLVPEDHIGVVSARQFDPPEFDRAESAASIISRHRDKCVRVWAARMGMEPCHDSKHLNGGLFLYSPRHHEQLFRHLRGVGESAGWTKWRLPEQASLSVLIDNTDAKVTWLPHEWNVVAAAQAHRPEHNTGVMNGFIYHFTGPTRRRARIQRTRWQKSPCDEIAQRLEDGSSWAEVGVADGYNALGVLSRRPQSKATLLDQWSVAGDRYRDSGDLAASLTEAQWAVVKDRAAGLTAPYSPRILDCDSIAGASAVQDGSLDLCYIDAEHTYEAVAADIAAWLPKVRRGGWIGGHDYDHPMERRGKWGVKRAVDEAFGGRVELGVDHTWWVKTTLDS